MMSRVYERICNNGIKVGLYKRIGESSEFPYVVRRNNSIVAEIDNLGDANREYHLRIRKEEAIYA